MKAAESERSGIQWKGLGRTAFAVPLAVGQTRRTSECAGAQDIARVLGDGADSPRAQALKEFFASGGTPCLTLCDERLYDPAWIGDDAGPGLRTGIHALLDREDVGTIVVLGLDSTTASSRREEQVLGLAERRPDVFFFLEHQGRAGSERWPGAFFELRPNAALVDTSRASLGGIAGYLETTDFRPQVEYLKPAVRLPSGVREGELKEIERWRRIAGLRRSIDLGTRWVVFESSHPLFWGSVERDLKAFLLRLERQGFLGSDGERALESWVHCGPEEELGVADAAHLSLQVVLRF